MSDCIIHPNKVNQKGYVNISFNGSKTRAHRVSYCIANGVTLESIKGLLVRHKCDVRNCVNPEHLELGSHQDNMDDMVSRGRSKKGEANWNVKINDEQCREILKVYVRGRKGYGLRTLAKKYGVALNTILMIVRGVRQVPPITEKEKA